MTSKSLARALCAIALAAPAVSTAQARGRTDGREGSEIGKGGYSRSSGGKLSLALNWGAGLPGSRDPLDGISGAPLSAGVTATWWFDEWFVMDVAPSHLFNSGRTNLFVGPRFRTPGHPFSAYAGLHAGAVWSDEMGLRFALSPQTGVEAVFGDHVLVGLGYAMDLPLSRDPTNHRVFMTAGYRF